jgi:hypothetical protein
MAKTPKPPKEKKVKTPRTPKPPKEKKVKTPRTPKTPKTPKPPKEKKAKTPRNNNAAQYSEQPYNNEDMYSNLHPSHPLHPNNRQKLVQDYSNAHFKPQTNQDDIYKNLHPSHPLHPNNRNKPAKPAKQVKTTPPPVYGKQTPEPLVRHPARRQQDHQIKYYDPYQNQEKHAYFEENEMPSRMESRASKPAKQGKLFTKSKQQPHIKRSVQVEKPLSYHEVWLYEHEWKAPLFSCFNDGIKVCLYVWCCYWCFVSVYENFLTK